MNLIISIPLDINDLEEQDFETFVKESRKASGITLEVGRPLKPERNDNVIRSVTLFAQNFTVKIDQQEVP